MTKKFILTITISIIIILGLTIFFYPKYCGGGGIYPGADEYDCDCSGFKGSLTPDNWVGDYVISCFGIPSNVHQIP